MGHSLESRWGWVWEHQLVLLLENPMEQWWGLLLGCHLVVPMEMLSVQAWEKELEFLMEGHWDGHMWEKVSGHLMEEHWDVHL